MKTDRQKMQNEEKQNMKIKKGKRKIRKQDTSTI